MRRSLAAGLIATMSIVAGCVTSSSDAPAAIVEMPRLDLALDPTDCHLGLIFFLTTMEQAQELLPDGFVARDAQAVLGTPAPTGRGAVAISNIECADGSQGAFGWSEIMVATHAPTVNATLEPSTVDFYAHAFHVTQGPARDAFAQAGWTLLEGEQTVTVDAAPVGGSSSGTLSDASGAVWEFTITGAATITATALERIWHATPQGLAFLENDYSNQAWLGDATCTIATGSLAAEAVGATSCAKGEVVGAAVPKQTWKSRLVTLPGVHAEA